jgi:hypothetical protein
MGATQQANVPPPPHHSENTTSQSTTDTTPTTNLLQVANRYTITDLTTLQGSTCCVDASTSPDKLPSPADEAGIGIFLVNTQVLPTQMVYIAARLNASTSVLMAEAAALALASTVTDRMNLQGINFLSDCAQLVQFLNMQDHTNPPDWRSKHFTQIFSKPPFRCQKFCQNFQIPRHIESLNVCMKH